ncbi:glyoxylase-like metal-dependent hydrolase (beta-lactamase superfamily II) [Granulicella aggregans]|uniref:Glyoxylase-like metal-dependent hydrolase (Beta-lactamase superfamily II) n=1 Tax=Granulicella aggregans TaxID=474949 RepID=A0A7W8E2Y2_9BACT|nr:MBL fold metallo-hydrolase [Granulicella aggregans]MBB5056659.1 glyoxylase-like metal-dependent hydrolase (beta-lactamase superfamily II) [Granulicella aggregans]
MTRGWVVGVAAVLYVGTATTAWTQALPAFTLEGLTNGAWAAIDNAAAKADESGSNAGFVIGADGVLVVDTFENPAAAKKMLEAIREKTKLPVKYVVNTHYHLDHVAGNAVFAGAGAVVMAHENVREWERTENLKFFGEKPTAEQKAMVEGLYLPDVTYEREAMAYIGAKHGVELKYMAGHTGGDTVVYDAESNVVFCGDLFWNKTLPNLIDASTKEWIETLDTLVQDHPTAKFVPGHGDHAGGAGDVKAFRDYLAFLRDAIAKAQAGGAKGDAVVKAVLPEIKAKYGDWAFPEFMEPDIQRTDEELRGVKRLPPVAKK